MMRRTRGRGRSQWSVPLAPTEPRPSIRSAAHIQPLPARHARTCRHTAVPCALTRRRRRTRTNTVESVVDTPRTHAAAVNPAQLLPHASRHTTGARRSRRHQPFPTLRWHGELLQGPRPRRSTTTLKTIYTTQAPIKDRYRGAHRGALRGYPWRCSSGRKFPGSRAA